MSKMKAIETTTDDVLAAISECLADIDDASELAVLEAVRADIDRRIALVLPPSNEDPADACVVRVWDSSLGMAGDWGECGSAMNDHERCERHRSA